MLFQALSRRPNTLPDFAHCVLPPWHVPGCNYPAWHKLDALVQAHQWLNNTRAAVEPHVSTIDGLSAPPWIVPAFDRPGCPGKATDDYTFEHIFSSKKKRRHRYGMRLSCCSPWRQMLQVKIKV